MELNNNSSPKLSKVLLISGVVVLLLGIISLSVYFGTKSSSASSSGPSSGPLVTYSPTIPATLAPTTPPLVLLQSKINDLVSGRLPINNLRVLNRLTVTNNNPNDAFTLKLINNSDKNVITFMLTSNPSNTFGIQRSPTTPAPTLPTPSPTNLPNQLVLSQPVSLVGTQPVPSLSSLQQQLASIMAGTLPLNNLKVNGNLTVISGDAYPVNLINMSGSNKLSSCVLFAKNNVIRGYYGMSAMYNSNNRSVYDQYSVNVSYSNSNWDSRSTMPSCSPIPNITAGPTQAPTIDYLNSVLNDIVNGNIPIPNLNVIGDLTVNGNDDSLLFLNKTNCDPTTLVTFNTWTSSRGINGYAGPWDWYDHAGAAIRTLLN